MLIYPVRSCTVVFAAFLLTEVIPFLHASFDSYRSLHAIISPFGALSLNLNLPRESLDISNSALAIIFLRRTARQRDIRNSSSQTKSRFNPSRQELPRAHARPLAQICAQCPLSVVNLRPRMIKCARRHLVTAVSPLRCPGKKTNCSPTQWF